MKHVFTAWAGISARATSAKRILLMSDFDGTLSRIAVSPGEAKLDGGIRELLGTVARNPVFRIAVVSGRQLAEIKRMVSLPGLYYVGNHGLELSGPGLRYLHPRAKQIRPLMEEIRRRLEVDLGNIPGIIIEDKTLGISVHYRRLTGEALKRAKETFARFRKRTLPRGAVKVSGGKRVWEIKADINWNKGKAVLLLGRKLYRKGVKFLPVYLGDDLTDEDAFAVLREKGVTVRVGRSRQSRAEFYLRSVREVKEFLRRLIALCT